MKTKEQIKADLRFGRFARIAMIILIVILALVAVLSSIDIYFFGLNKFNFVLLFAPSILVYNCFLVVEIADKNILRLKNIPLKEE
ncbi:MAG: hypothetical protein US83_C0003G0042 [Candidatus Falkowbacteria bacterium GW2011_GWC2_38_22]|uniref:Uncharacterized protein n=1 Tax=Candidatus Falkowbacteria bacterium GW2011_GWE1_38_31 TaxID=1618638 RepID=A0A0G0JXA8_9BACT|nr:MAG: hypothetical protein US73_C0001G0134 [Candidatus Falkowbacteria bacterium GW2011_GWF2_38_1205]KKQ61793.1 MAG: hypothetical protein US83_C0003G0042 [Candidatus Falkowbacteria bacterium GW2011_GWC2_38_22]KKQ64101.1 MAG: hypothetical protein US84_C0002G0133 [Candidatus Falkowbacteria bacterium GW2011_GWF1_38_22]KKQ66549.1 MAG: hypothetical protein US87_C0001G0070 [Candidatus Falkowbacteria bacterium GW2011_GWE2_38_254]KKQ71207.1 MAG: hypothetical protein US91_C0001G0134 [Candidatus Falkowb